MRHKRRVQLTCAVVLRLNQPDTWRERECVGVSVECVCARVFVCERDRKTDGQTGTVVCG